MKITGLEFVTVSVPFTDAIQEHWGWDYPTTLIWVSTDEGITGIGESNSLKSNITDRADEISAQYVGRNLWDLDIATETFSLQCAFYDIAAQALGVPAHKLFGQKARESVELAFWSPPMPPEVTASEARRGHDMGFRVHKLKARPDTIVETARLMTEACGPDYMINVDPNMTFVDLPTASRLARELEPYPIEVYEDPMKADDLSWYKQLRAKTNTPVARHLGDPRQVYTWLKNEAIDCFNCAGNVAGMRVMDGIAQGAGVPFWGQMFAFGSCIASMFAIHLASTLKNCTMSIDELPHIRLDDLSGGTLAIENGAVTVPDVPGLGVTLDMDAVENYRVR